MYKAYTGVVLLAVFLLGFSTIGLLPAQAAVVRGGDSYSVPAGTELSGDLYFLGNTLTIHGTTTGDVYGVGSQMISQGVVEGDTLYVAGRATLEGVTHGDARLIAGEVKIVGTVVEDVVVLGGNVIVTEDARIEGDLLVYGDYLRIEGVVAGVAEAHVRVAEVKGRVEHDLTVYARESLGVLGDAVIGGDLVYTAPREGFISGTVTITGEESYTKTQQRVSRTGFSLLTTLLHILLYVAGALLLLIVFPDFSKEVVSRAMKESTWLALRGFVLVFALPVIGLVLIVSVIGLLPGVIVLCAYGAGVTLSLAFSGIFAGTVLAQWMKQEGRHPMAWAALGGAVVVLLSLLPMVGWLVRALLLFLMFGTLCMFAYERIWLVRGRGRATTKDTTEKTV